MDLLFPLIVLAIIVFIIRQRRASQQQAQVNLENGRAFMEKNADEEGVVTTDSGLQYQVLEAGSGSDHPTASSKVKVHYHGTLIDGTVFDSSVDRGEPIEFGLNQVIPGWTEGLQLMVVGEKTRFFIPAALAYGNGSAGVITPGSTLIFDVELLDFS